MQPVSMISGCRAGICALAALTLGGSSMPARDADEGFEYLERTDDGITVSRKPGRTAGLYVLRLETRSPIAPVALADRLWQGMSRSEPPVVERKFLRREPTEIVIHDRVKTPIVSDRDYTMQLRRVVDGDTREIVFQTVPELGPPLNPECVRLPIVQGFWQFRPDLQGGSVVRYQVYSEPGGSVPAFFVRDPQLQAALNDVRQSLRSVAR